MSLKLLNAFVDCLKNVHRLPVLTAVQVRLVTVMDVAATDKDEELLRNKDSTRYKRRLVKRQWEDKKKENGESDEKKLCEKPFERIKRKKVALLLGYCGVDYYGMQRNPGVRTIEEDLLKALWDAKYITEEDFITQQNAHFQRSSRTDKGVSAARQVVSLKLPLDIDIEEINKRLPESIKVFGVKRVTNKFNSKVKCSARTYSYTLPTYVFEPSAETEEQRLQYRIPSEKLEEVRNVLGVYKGTKCYHNFTEKKHFSDPSASRYMMGFNIEKVFVDSNMEFAVLLVKGQSFMLHQIRKMVGLAIAVVRGHTDKSTLERAFGKDKVMIPTAPGLGLVLDMVHYDTYDARHKNSHDSLTWESEEEAVQKFKHEHIYPIIIKGEVEGNSMASWLEKLSLHSYEPSEDVPEKETEDKVGDDDDDDKCCEKETEGKVMNDDDDEKFSDKETEDKVLDHADDEKCSDSETANISGTTSDVMANGGDKLDDGENVVSETSDKKTDSIA